MQIRFFEDHHICYLCSSLIAYQAADWTVRSVPEADITNTLSGNQWRAWGCERAIILGTPRMVGFMEYTRSNQ